MKYYLGEKNIVINCVYIVDFLQWGHIHLMVLLTELFSWYQSRVKHGISIRPLLATAGGLPSTPNIRLAQTQLAAHLASHLAILSPKAQANNNSLNKPYIFKQTANTKFQTSCSGRHDTLEQGAQHNYDTARVWRGTVHHRVVVLLQ